MRGGILLLVAGMIAHPGRLPGQRMSCSHADSVLRSEARGRQERIEAIGRTLRCPDTRVAAFTALLRHSSPETVGDTLGGLAAWTLFDSQLVDSVAVLSKDARQSQQRRVFHLALLTRYSDCHIALDMNALYQPMATVLGGNIHGCSSTEQFPLHALSVRDRGRARAAIAWMGQHDPDARLRALAAQVSEELNFIWTAGRQTPSRPH